MKKITFMVTQIVNSKTQRVAVQ